MFRPLPLCLVLLCLLLLFPLATYADSGALMSASQRVFTPNAGQIIDDSGNQRPDVLFKSQAGNSEMYLRTTGFSYVFTRIDPGDAPTSSPARLTPLDTDAAQDRRMVTRYRMDMELLGANPAASIEQSAVIPGLENFYRGRNHAALGVQSCAEVLYREVYPHIDLRLYYSENGLKYDFLVRPGGNPADIRMQYVGATGIRLLDDGSMLVSNPHGQLKEDKPYTYQRTGRDKTLSDSEVDPRREVRSSFRAYGAAVGFELGAYDPKQLLVIDPGVVWGTFYGGNGADGFNDVFRHADGSVVAVGFTSSFDFPTTPGIDKQTSLAGSRDAMVVKFSGDRARDRIWATYFGGVSAEEANAVWVNNVGAVHVVGSTISEDFPLKNAFQTTISTNTRVAFVSQLNPDQGILRWSSYYGGDGTDDGVDITGRVLNGVTSLVICGSTRSQAGTFPLKGAEKQTKNDKFDMFVARITNGGAPLWSTFFGGTEDDYATGVTMDSDGNVIMVGWTRSDDIEGTAGAFQPANAGGIDGVVAKFSGSGGTKIWVSHLGTEGRDLARDVVTLPTNDNLIITGETHHTSFPVFNGFQSTPNSITDDPVFSDMFFFEMDKNGRRQWASLFGGDSIDRGVSLAAFEDGSFAFTGETNSDIIFLTSDALRDDGEDTLGAAFLGLVTAERELIYSSYFFQKNLDYAHAVVPVGPSVREGNVIIAGAYRSDSMPVTDNAFQKFVKGVSETGYIMEYGCGAYTEIAADGPLEFCDGGSVVLDAGEGFVEYLWSNGAETQTIEVDVSGDYSVKVIDDDDCEFTSPPTAVSVFPIPDPVISADGPTELCNGESVTLDAGAGYEKYEWANGAETQTITVTETDEYFVIVTGEGGCEAETSIAVNVRPTPIVNVQPTALDWGILSGCQSSVNLPLTLTNENLFPIRLSELEFSNAAEFGAANFAPDMQLEPDEAVTLNIVFTPATLDPVNAELRIKIAPCDVELVIPLTGRKGELLLTATPSTIDFGDVFLCANTPKEQEVEFVNSGDENVILENSQSNPPFAVVDQDRLPLTITPGETETLTIQFAPVAAGPASSEVSVNYRSGSCNDNIRILVSGRGRDADLELVNNAVLQFPRVGDCDESVDAELLLNISGGADGPLQILTIEDESGQVTSQSDLPLELAVADLVRLPLRLTPNAEGVVSGSATITYELDGCSKTLEFDYSGEKRGISISLPESIDFGAYYSCADVALTQRVQLEVSGAEAFVDEVIIEGDFASNIQRQAPAPDFFNITFVTDSPEATGSMTIRFSPCGIERVIQLSGRRIDLDMSGPESQDFGSVQLGEAPTRTITWTNAANAGSGAISIARIDCLAEPFSLVSPTEFPLELEVGESIEVIVEFDPQAVGTFDGELCLRAIDPCELTFRTALTGAGIDDVVLPAELEVYIPELVANPHWASFDIPILVRGLEGFDGDFDVEALAYLRMNSTVFFPRSLAGGAIDANVSNLGERSLLLRSGPVTLAEDGPLAVLSGAPLLGDAVTSEIVIDSVVFIGREVNATLTGGSLTLDSLCEVDGTRLLTTAPRFGIIGLTPNPSDAPPEFQVRGIEGAGLQMQIRAANGRTVFERSWQNAGANLMTVRPVVTLAPGIYQVVLNAEFRSDERLFVIVR